ncbi:MAG: hypothetical protein JNJ93_11855 [Acinetobacter sp.]|nr:hypothetical protein [Acinetobacter sp.]
MQGAAGDLPLNALNPLNTQPFNENVYAFLNGGAITINNSDDFFAGKNILFRLKTI